MKTKSKASKFDVEVGKRIKLVRLQRGLSMQALSKQIGISYQQFQKYESGMNRIPTGKLLQIANLLDVSVAYVLNNDDNVVVSGLIDLRNNEDRQLLKYWGQIKSPKKRKLILDFIRNISQFS